MKVEKEFYNPLLRRKELTIVVQRDSTPSRKEARDIVVSLTGASPDLVVIKEIRTPTGMRYHTVVAYVYEDPSTLKVVEPEYILKRGEEGEAQAE